MRILILGAGALGGYFGARLLAAGRDVTFLVRPRRAALLAAHGLRVISAHRGDLHLPAPPTVTAETIAAPYDLVLVSAKAYDLESAMDAIAPAVGPETLILPMLNGMAHMAALDARFGPGRVLGGTCFISSTLRPDGTVVHLNQREGFFFGARGEGLPQARLDALSGALLDARFDARLRPDIMQDMWEKWSFITSLAGISCLLRANIGTIHAAGATPLALALFRECIAVAEAEGHRPSEPYIAQHDDFLSQPGSTLEGSMLRDLEAGQPIEAEQIAGDMLRHAELHGLATPILRTVYAHLRAYEVRRQQSTP